MVGKVITSETVICALEAYIYKEVTMYYDKKIASNCVDALFKCLYLNFRSSLMYIPTSNNDNSILHKSIYDDFNGHNHMDLSIKYRRSLQNIYAIIKQQKHIQVALHQTDIFPISSFNKSKPITQIVFDEYLYDDLIKLGLEDKTAKLIVTNLYIFLCKNYPGISICVTKKMQKERAKITQQSLF